MKRYKNLLIYILLLLCGVGVSIVVSMILRLNPDAKLKEFSIEFSTQQIPALIEDEEGNETEESLVTIEEIDGDNSANECGEDEECGMGKYIYAPTDSFTAFKDYTISKCWDVDEHYGGQCWDLAALFWENYTEDGRVLSTCGTHSAKGAWNCKEQNAGSEFELITDTHSLQPGDWIIFNSGKYGHVGMAMGSYNNGYISLLGQNQGGAACSGGGSSTNIINISLKSFAGAFRPKSYIKPAPQPSPVPVSGCLDWHVEKGDTMSKIMLECEGIVVYGQGMDEYAKSWYSLIYNKGKSVYDGWHSKNGVGLYAGDDIEHRIK